MTDQASPEIRMYLVAGTAVEVDEDELSLEALVEDPLAEGVPGPPLPLIDRIRRALLGGYDGLTDLLGDWGLLDDVEAVVEVAEYDEQGRRHFSSMNVTHEMFSQAAALRQARDMLLTAQASRERAAAKVEDLDTGDEVL